MKTGKQIPKNEGQPAQPVSLPGRSTHGRIFSTPAQDTCLDAIQLDRLEQSYREWAEASLRSDVRLARHRILLIFLLIRYTGAKLSEVLGLNPELDIDVGKRMVTFGRTQDGSIRSRREVRLSESLCRDVRTLVAKPLDDEDAARRFFRVDPGFVRKKFYERAEACGFGKQLGAPESLRKSRGVELMQNNMPLPAVQVLLGHSTPNLTSAYLPFSEDDIQQVIGVFMEKESARKTSARNSFFGKIETIRQGDIQTQIKMVTMGGYPLTTIITNDSLHRLGLKVGKLVTAEVKAPWIVLQKTGVGMTTSADNVLDGVVEKIARGEVNTEYGVRIPDGTEVCALVTTESARRLALGEGDDVRVLFSAYAVVLLSD